MQLGSMALPNISSYTIDITQHALKGQKLLAQGNALGIMSVSNAPCMGKSFKIYLIKKENPLQYVKLLPVVLKLLPLQGARFATHKNPGRCPGLRASAPSGRVAYMSLLGVLLTWAFGPLWRAAYMSFLALLGCVEYTCETYLTIILYVLPPRFTMFRPFCRPWVRRPFASQYSASASRLLADDATGLQFRLRINKIGPQSHRSCAHHDSQYA